jgi:hypothetical protein
MSSCSDLLFQLSDHHYGNSPKGVFIAVDVISCVSVLCLSFIVPKLVVRFYQLITLHQTLYVDVSYHITENNKDLNTGCKFFHARD